MRVLEITYSWPAETFIVRHAVALTTHTKINLTLGSRSPVSTLSSSLQPAETSGFRVVMLPNFDHLPSIRKLVASIVGVASDPKLLTSRSIRDSVLLRRLSGLQPDIIHFHTSSLAVLMSKYAKTLKIPYTFSLRGSDIQVMPRTIDGYTDNLCKTALDASGIHTVADALAIQLEQLCNCKLPWSTIRTCVPIPAEPPPKDSTSSQIRLISVGRLHWRKAYHDLIRAMKHLPEEFRLDIVGDGTEREHLTYLIHALGLDQRVTLHGDLPYDKFQVLLLNATAYVQSSIAEGFSNAVAEAMALGIPVFATPVGGTKEIIETGLNGIILPLGDTRQMADVLLTALDSTLMNDLGQRARATAIREFTEEKHAMKFERFYYNAVTSSK